MIKSAYSFATKKEKVENHIIVVWVDNETGVLARVVGLFSGRGYNIDSLNVTEVDKKKNISRITITTSGTPQVLQQIRLQLRKLVPVHKVADFPSNKKTLIREMALLKIVSSKTQHAVQTAPDYIHMHSILPSQSTALPQHLHAAASSKTAHVRHSKMHFRELARDQACSELTRTHSRPD